MSVHVTNSDVQQWIQDARMTITNVDPQLDSSAYSRVAGTLSNRYDVTTWTDSNSTPALVRSVISMLIAAWTINRSHAEAVEDVDSYGRHLESSALNLLAGLADGSILLDAASAPESVVGEPAFWPTDIATTIANTDGWDADGAAPLMFSTGKVF